MTKNLRTFYIMAITQVISVIGSQMSMFALGIWIFADTGNTTPLLLVAFFQTLPGMLAGSLTGVFADRWDRRRTIMLTDAGQALPTFLIMLSFMTGNFEVWQLYIATLVGGIFGTLQSSSVLASTTMLVPEDQRDRANAIQQMIMPLAGLIAPVLAGFLYAVIDVEGIILLDLLTFILAVAVVSQITIPQPEKSAESQKSKGSVWKEMRGAFQFLWERPTLFILMFYVAAINFLLAGPLNLVTPYILSLTDSERALGIIQGLANVGAIVGAILVGVWGGTRPRIHTIMIGLIFTALFVMLFGTARHSITLAITFFLLMLPTPIVNTLFYSIMQIKTPPDMQGAFSPCSTKWR